MSDRIQIEILNSESNSVSVDGINQPQEQAQLNEKSSKVIKQAAVIGAMATMAVATNLFLENISLMDKEKKTTIQAEQLRILTGTYRNSGGRDR